jgi:hypothetical protein
MNPLQIGMGILQAGGNLLGIFGKQQRKSIDPEWLRQNFGAGAVNSELMQLYNRAINSVQGQQLMTGAAQQGQEMQTQEARSAAQAGLGAAGGAGSGTDIQAGASAAGYVSGIQNQTKAGLMESFIPYASQIVQDRLNAYMTGQRMQAMYPYQNLNWSQFGNLLSDYGQKGVDFYGQPKQAASNVTPGNGAPISVDPNAPPVAPGGQPMPQQARAGTGAEPLLAQAEEGRMREFMTPQFQAGQIPQFAGPRAAQFQNQQIGRMPRSSRFQQAMQTAGGGGMSPFMMAAGGGSASGNARFG